jgi:hypothetical protein
MVALVGFSVSRSASPGRGYQDFQIRQSFWDRGFQKATSFLSTVIGNVHPAVHPLAVKGMSELGRASSDLRSNALHFVVDSAVGY